MPVHGGVAKAMGLYPEAFCKAGKIVPAKGREAALRRKGKKRRSIRI